MNDHQSEQYAVQYVAVRLLFMIYIIQDQFLYIYFLFVYCIFIYELTWLKMNSAAISSIPAPDSVLILRRSH